MKTTNIFLNRILKKLDNHISDPYLENMVFLLSFGLNELRADCLINTQNMQRAFPTLQCHAHQHQRERRTKNNPKKSLAWILLYFWIRVMLAFSPAVACKVSFMNFLKPRPSFTWSGNVKIYFLEKKNICENKMSGGSRPDLFSQTCHSPTPHRWNPIHPLWGNPSNKQFLNIPQIVFLSGRIPKMSLCWIEG